MREGPCRSILVVGGGFSGATLIIQLARQLRGNLDVVLVEPSAEPGRGVAYSTRDGAHRVNVPTDYMALSEEDTGEATRWFEERGLLTDPNSGLNGGVAYVSRHDYGTFVSSRLVEATSHAADRMRFEHRRTVVKSIRRHDGRWLAALADGGSVEADLVALCFGHSVPRIPFEMGDGVLDNEKFVANPWADNALSALAPTDSVLVVGTGLTMVDVVLGLRAKGHSGRITAVSRHGLIPRPHRDFRDKDDFLDNEPLPNTALGLLRSARARARTVGLEVGWQPIADAISAKLPVIWRSFPVSEKARAIRRLLPFWDVHRFRIPAYSHALLSREAGEGVLAIVKSAVARVTATATGFEATLGYRNGNSEDRRFDAVVVCTGPDKNLRKNELVAALLEEGVARLDDSELGIAVDEQSRVIGADGCAKRDMFAFGPMTRSSFGEMSGANDIAAQIERVTRDILVGALGTESDDAAAGEAGSRDSVPQQPEKYNCIQV